MSASEKYHTADEAVLATFERLWNKYEQPNTLSDDFVKEYFEEIKPFVSHGTVTTKPLEWDVHLAKNSSRSLRVSHAKEGPVALKFSAQLDAEKGQWLDARAQAYGITEGEQFYRKERTKGDFIRISVFRSGDSTKIWELITVDSTPFQPELGVVDFGTGVWAIES
ncbi:hypothetical protein BDV93DRAFT_524372 [Ceratobasidium sp. AG-I]|nr:hypothetical protein BDV93DRAFT_524372 [Ceratobasidium sp. AG-I]